MAIIPCQTLRRKVSIGCLACRCSRLRPRVGQACAGRQRSLFASYRVVQCTVDGMVVRRAKGYVHSKRITHVFKVCGYGIRCCSPQSLWLQKHPSSEGTSQYGLWHGGRRSYRMPRRHQNQQLRCHHRSGSYGHLRLPAPSTQISGGCPAPFRRRQVRNWLTMIELELVSNLGSPQLTRKCHQFYHHM